MDQMSKERETSETIKAPLSDARNETLLKKRSDFDPKSYYGQLPLTTWQKSFIKVVSISYAKIRLNL